MTSPLAASAPPTLSGNPDTSQHGAARARQAPTEVDAAERARALRLEAAQRALAEARERHAAARVAERALTKAQRGERNGRGGLDPVRYGDWEVKGLATDF